MSYKNPNCCGGNCHDRLSDEEIAALSNNPRVVTTDEVVLEDKFAPVLPLEIPLIIRYVHDINDLRIFGLRGNLECYRAATKDGKFVGFRRKMKGVKVEEGDTELQIAACQGFCEISVDMSDGHKLIAKANSPKNVPYNKRATRIEAMRKLKKLIVLHLVDKMRNDAK